MFPTAHLKVTHYAWNKEELLRYITPEQVMERLGCPIPDEGLGTKFLSPFREDRRPDCKLFYSRGEVPILYFYDPTENLRLDWVGLVQYTQNNCSYQAALNWVAEAFGLEPGAPPSNEMKREAELIKARKVIVKPPAVIQIKSRPHTRSDIDWWAQYHISKDLLFTYRIWAISDYWLNGQHYRAPRRAYAYKEDDGFKLYFPDEDPRFKWLSSTNALSGYEQLPQTGALLVITSSKKDVVCLRSFGYPAVNPQGEGMDIPAHLLWELKQRFQKVVIFYDNDRPGVEAALKMKRGWQVDDLVVLPDITTKDPSDYCRTYGPEAAHHMFNKLFSPYVSNH